MLQQNLFTDSTGGAQVSVTSSTFADNLSLPVHRWFRYSAGFSAPWVGDLIRRERARGRQAVLDPFAGSGTVLLEGETNGVTAIGIEAHPFVARVARAKLHWRSDVTEFLDYGREILSEARRAGGSTDGYPSLVERCYTPESLEQLDALRRAWSARADGGALSELVFLAIAAILRECSPVGTAQWQYVLPNKRKERVREPFAAFAARLAIMAEDMATRQCAVVETAARLIQADSRETGTLPDVSTDLVVTSPPYANNFDYADATRLEMSFFREIGGWADLRQSVRTHLVRSCSQHAGPDATSLIPVVEDPLLAPLRQELPDKVQALSEVKLEHGGRKAYDAMVALYFLDLAKVWIALRQACRPGALACFVVGDSAPYSVHIPVDRWLGELAIAAGFSSYSFEKLRDRNTKWKNRKHRVPLHEGRLWVKG